MRGRAPKLGQDVGQPRLGLAFAAESREQEAVAHPRFRADEVVGQRPVFLQRLLVARAGLERAGIEQVRLGRLVVGKARAQVVENRDRIDCLVSPNWARALPTM